MHHRTPAVLVLFLLCSILICSAFQAHAQEQAQPQAGVDSLTPSLGQQPTIYPNGTKLSFDHILSIYEWDGEFRFSHPHQVLTGIGLTPIPRAGVSASNNSIQTDTVFLSGKSRFLEDNSITSTEALGFLSADEPLGLNYPFKPFLMFSGTSYATSGLPGLGSSTIITRQTEGFGIAGIRSQVPGTALELSLGGGLTRQSQQALTTEEPLSAFGTMIRGDLFVPLEPATENTWWQAEGLADERFYHERNQRYSNDRIFVRAASALIPPESSPGHAASAAGANVASINLGLNRRDYFVGQDSSAGNALPSAKQERTEYSMLVVDSLNYPIAENHLFSDASIEFEPRSVVRRSDAGANLLVNQGLSALSSLLAPNDVSSLRLAASGRINYESQARSPLLGPNDLLSQEAGDVGMDARIGYEEQSQNVRLLSDEITGIDESSITRLSSTLDEASFVTRLTTAGFEVRYAPMNRSLLRLVGNARLLNYDTPSESNDDDHDQLVSSAELHFDRFFSPSLTGNLGIIASNTHLVYLKSDRSAQNNVTRSIALDPEATYSTSEFFTHIRGEVFANYTILDYLSSLPSLQAVGDYVLRGASLTDSIGFSLGLRPFAELEPISFEEGMTVRLSERGNFNADAFSERRDARIAEISASALLGIASHGGAAPWSVRAGVRGFLLSTSGRTSAQEQPTPSFGELQRQTRIGPMITMLLMRSSSFMPVLSATAWYAVIKSETFDVPSVTRTPQLESHLQVQWAF